MDDLKRHIKQELKHIEDNVDIMEEGIKIKEILGKSVSSDRLKLRGLKDKLEKLKAICDCE